MRCGLGERAHCQREAHNQKAQWGSPQLEAGKTLNHDEGERQKHVGNTLVGNQSVTCLDTMFL